MLVSPKWQRRESRVAPLSPQIVRLRKALANWERDEAIKRRDVPVIPRKMNADRKRHLIDRAIDGLSGWRFSHFEHEATVRQALRVKFIHEGSSWAEADATAAHIVEHALHRIGAKRPTWAQGQPEYQERHKHDAYRYCQNHRCRRMLTEDQPKYCCENCAINHRNYRWKQDNADAVKAAARVYGQTVPKETKAEQWQNWRDKWDTSDCATCGKPFKARPGRKSLYCSRVCSNRRPGR